VKKCGYGFHCIIFLSNRQ